jgi:hypothetical protein
MAAKTGLTRINSDKFYTKPEAVKMCINLLPKITSRDIVIEPSAGNGSFSNILKTKFENVVAIDIEPEEQGIITADFLTYDFGDLEKYRKIHCVGNPPFGRQSSLARKFIKHASSFCDTISFILPKSFKKETYIKTFPLNFHLVSQTELESNSYTVDDEDYSVPCVFQVWEKREIAREVSEKVVPTLYKYVKKTENPDFAIRRVGFYAGLVSDDWQDKNIQSHYFIKLVDCEKDYFKELYKGVEFVFDNTVGPRSISKTELNSKIIKLT